MTPDPSYSTLARTYLSRLGERPAGYTSVTPWELIAWRSVGDTPGLVWSEVLEPCQIIALSMMGLRTVHKLDHHTTQELSEQYYALYIDLIEESIKGLPE